MITADKKWLLVFLAGYGIFAALPFLAPVMMRLGWQSVGATIYLVYSFLCHQLPERSLFLFGAKPMYSLTEIQSVWQNTDNPLILRQFIGNPQMGWKVAWSDRMISLYGGIWLAGLLWTALPRRAGNVSIWFFILLGMPMALDGVTHLISDFNGLAAGFRYTNDWLAVLTNHAFAASFYAGDALGSFNSWMRWMTGFLFSFGLVWWIFPLVDEQLGEKPSPEMV